jgi:hypothetical protein
MTVETRRLLSEAAINVQGVVGDDSGFSADILTNNIDDDDYEQHEADTSTSTDGSGTDMDDEDAVGQDSATVSAAQVIRR